MYVHCEIRYKAKRNHFMISFELKTVFRSLSTIIVLVWWQLMQFTGNNFFVLNEANSFPSSFPLALKGLFFVSFALFNEPSRPFSRFVRIKTYLFVYSWQPWISYFTFVRSLSLFTRLIFFIISLMPYFRLIRSISCCSNLSILVLKSDPLISSLISLVISSRLSFS